MRILGIRRSALLWTLYEVLRPHGSAAVAMFVCQPFSLSAMRAYKRLAELPAKYPDIAVTTYEGDFLEMLPSILRDIPRDAFAFFLIDPKGWHIPLKKLGALLARDHSEVVFNFMFDFINRAASIKDDAVAAGLNELMPFGDWRARLEGAARTPSTPDDRKAILVEAFKACLAQLGRYVYVCETTVLRPVENRPLYCLFYATRHDIGIEVFRDCQVKALEAQSKTRATTKIRHAESNTGQGEFFQSLNEMGPNEFTADLRAEQNAAEKTIMELVPDGPSSILYRNLWPQILARHVVRRPDVNKIAAQMRRDGRLEFPDWEKGKQVPQPNYRVRRVRGII
jgi:hypothetical protein